MRRQTEHVKQLKSMYSREDARLKGPPGWEKLPLFWFLLFLSYKCTRRCKFCYSFNQVGDGSPTEMDERTFDRLLDWIPQVWKANNVKVNSVGFLGGEPLLRTDRIRKVMDSVYKNTDGMQGYLYTNGDLIDSVNWDDLEDIQWISTNITDISIDELSHRMDVVRTRSNVINQTVVATLDDFNLDRILDVTRFGIENGYRLRYYRDLFRGIDSEYHERLRVKYHGLCDLLEQYIDKGYSVHTTFLLDTLVPSWNHDSSPYPCGKRIAKVNPDGSFGPCIRNQKFKTGTIFDPDPLEKLQSSTFHYDFASPNAPAECKECAVRAVCQGGCPNDRLLLTGTVSGKSLMCEIHKEIIPRLNNLDKLQAGRRVPGEPSVAFPPV
ncbi:MAG: SPASM domain-containing protein [Syntrophobacteraceae bacterium]|nr:SPASM domain-containing protein [Syntrophobacteraceae bacterium]